MTFKPVELNEIEELSKKNNKSSKVVDMLKEFNNSEHSAVRLENVSTKYMHQAAARMNMLSKREKLNIVARVRNNQIYLLKADAVTK